MRMLTLSLAGAVATMLSLGALLAQPGGGPGAGGATSRPAMHHGDPNGPGGGFHLLPRELADKLNLTDDQRNQIHELAKETKAKLDQILTADQKKLLDEFRPPHPGQGQGGPGGGPSGPSSRPACQ